MKRIKNNSYWEKRSLQIEARAAKKADKFQQDIEKKYIRALSSIQRSIESFYIRYAEAEGIDYATAKRNLSHAEKETWEVDLEEYKKMALDEEFTNQIESMYSASRISRLQALQSQIRAQIEVLNKNGSELTETLLQDTFTDTYYRTVYEIQTGTGIGTNFAIYNQDAVDMIIRKPWKGSNFSDRWGTDKNKLLDELEAALMQSFIRGDSIDKTIDTVAKRMKRSKDWAANLVQTESAFIAGEATAAAYQETGVRKYKFLATLDLKTSNICRDLDGKPFDLKDKKVAVNYPPMHCFCRSTTVPDFEDIESYSKRIARKSDGKSYYVPEDMKYADWYAEYVAGRPEELLAEKKLKNKASDKKQYEKYKKVLDGPILKSFDNFQEMKYNDIKTWELMKDFYKSRESNMISAVNSFSDYISYKERIEKELVGLTSVNGIQIKGQSKHFLERVFGTTEDPNTGLPRSGVELNDIKEAILKGDVRIRKADPNSIKLITNKCMVSINPNTGILIQVNPQ